MAIDLQIEVQGDKEMIAKLKGYTRKLNDLRPATTAIGKHMTIFYATQPFLSQGGVFGERWDPLNPQYRKWKSKKYPGKGILVREGTMQKSFVYDADKDSVRITNTADHFRHHQLGEGVPQRVMMKLDKARRRTAADILREEIIEMFRGI